MTTDFIEKQIEHYGGPFCFIEQTLQKTGPLNSDLTQSSEFIIDIFNYVATIRHLNKNAANEIVNPYNLGFKNNLFFLLK